jgi:AcrR family transcriptional regulator
MARPLVDLLWRDHPQAPRRGARGPQARRTTDEVVTHAIAVADAGTLGAVTIRALAESLGMSTMSVYTHVNGREDLLVLMADHAHLTMTLTPWGRTRWRARVRRIAKENLDLIQRHPWLLEVTDPRVVLGPGTIAKYDHELHAFDHTGLDHLDRDAALTFLLDFVRAGAASLLPGSKVEDFAETWAQAAERLGGYLSSDYPLAQEVGRAAGEAMGGPYDAHRAWEFGLARVITGLADIIEP